MLDESTTDGVSIHESFLRVSSGSILGFSFASLDVRAVAFDGDRERAALRKSDRGTLSPEIVGCRAAGSSGSSGGVGFELSEGDVFGGPIARMAVALGVTFGSRFQRADACFNGPIVPWRMGRREQAKDIFRFDEGPSLFGNEGRTVIAFQDEGSAVDGEETGEAADGGVGGHVGDRSPEKL